MFSFNAIYIQLLKETHKTRVAVTESYTSVSVFVTLRSCEAIKASDFFLLLFPLSWNCAGILLSFMYTTYGTLFLYLDSTKCAIKVYVLCRTERKCNDDRYASARP